MALASIASIASTRTQHVTGTLPEEFWKAKVSWRGVADVLVVGDSRACRGVDSWALQAGLHSQRQVYNFGFDNQGYTEAYLDAAVRALRSPRSDTVLLLTVNPQSFSEPAMRDNGYAAESAGAPRGANGPLRRSLARLLYPLRPVRPDRLSHLFGGGGFLFHYDERGFVASRRVPEEPEQQLPVYRKRLGAEPARPAHVARVLAYAKALVDSEVRVFATRVPTTDAMRELENAIGGFNEDDFATRLEPIGGHYLPTPAGHFVSYDGSHLRDDSARRYSRALGRRLARELAHRSAEMTTADDRPADGY